MNTIIQNYNTGELKIVDIPYPQIQRGMVLVKTSYSLISAGTEKTKIDTGRMSLIGKARSRPDLVRKVIDKARKEGIWKTWETVSQRLNTPIALGYSCAGEVLEVADDVEGIRRGDLVACGGDHANHAEIVCVPKNLVVRVPEGVGVDQAAFATVGAIAMQGVRLADARVGEKVAVIGLGLVGLLTVRILNAAGCQVVGIDLDPDKIAAGRKSGCVDAISGEDEGLLEKIILFTSGHGVDATIVTAGTKSNRPIEQAGEITREKGKVVVVGAVGMDVPREPYYMKEIELVISRSYGPGRYDRSYEDQGIDYPFPYVRFTEQRNMESFLELIAARRMDLTPIITHRFPFEDATKAYDLVHGEKSENYLGILLEYKRDEKDIPVRVEHRAKGIGKGKITIGVIGAGNYATGNLLPHLKNLPDVAFGSICTASGMTASGALEKFGFRSAESDVERVIDDSDAVLIATRHNLHADLALRALGKGKAVFVEKPLVLKQEELDAFIEIGQKGFDGTLMVGLNRRFSPAVTALQSHFGPPSGPRQVLIRVNAGPIPLDHWIQDAEVGGGRLLGEGCHFVDLALALTGESISTVSASAIPTPGRPPVLWDDFSIILGMSGGSVCSIVYTSIGSRNVPKEYIEVASGGKTGIIHNFENVELWSDKGGKKRKSLTPDKGQKRQIGDWVEGIRKGVSPIPFQEIINVHQACLAAGQSMKNRETVLL